VNQSTTSMIGNKDKSMISNAVSNFTAEILKAINGMNKSRFDLTFRTSRWGNRPTTHYNLKDQMTGITVGFTIEGPPEYTYEPVLGDISCCSKSQWMNKEELLTIAKVCLRYRMMLDTASRLKELSKEEKNHMKLFMAHYK